MRINRIAARLGLGIILANVILLLIPSSCYLDSSFIVDKTKYLIRRLGEADEYLSHESHRELAQIGEAAVPKLIKALDDEDPRIRISIVEILGRIGRPAESIVPALIKIMGDEDAKVRGNAAFVLRNFSESAEAVPALIKAMGDENGYVRGNASYALAKIGKPAVPALMEVLRNEDADIRYSIVDLLARIGEPAIPALLEALEDRFDRELQNNAAWALKMIGPPAKKPALELIEVSEGRHDGEFGSFLDVYELVRYFTPAQSQYDRAKEAYLSGQYDRAKPILMNLLESSSQEKVVLWGYNLINVAPAALDMLGKIHLKEGNIPAAMEYFGRMVDYGDASFMGPKNGEQVYGGPSAAQGIFEQMKILADVTLDCDAASQLAYTLIEKYEGVQKPIIEGIWNYEDAAIHSIMRCLWKKNAPLEVWETELRKLISKIKNQHRKANLLITLGRKSEELGDTDRAIQVYEEVIQSYAGLYVASGADGLQKVYSLDALERLAEIYKNQEGAESRLIEIRKEMKEHYENAYQALIEDKTYIYMLEERYGKLAR